MRARRDGTMGVFRSIDQPVAARENSIRLYVNAVSARVFETQILETTMCDFDRIEKKEEEFS